MKVFNEFILSQSAFTAEVGAPIERIDIADGLFHLPGAEYQRCCPPDHTAAGVTTTDDGRLMFINVETIGTGLVGQHYVADEATPTFCRMNSISDVFTAAGRTQVNVVWELIAKGIEGGRTRYTNRVRPHPTDAFMSFLAEQGQTFNPAASGEHNRRKTPLYAASIGGNAPIRKGDAQ